MYYQHALKYVYRNPVKAGLCSLVEEYEFSSLRYHLTNNDLGFPICESTYYPWGMLGLSPIAQLNWLNLKYDEKEEDCIRRALSRRAFRITCDPKTRKMPGIFKEPLSQEGRPYLLVTGR
jgi:hypothetical protein